MIVDGYQILIGATTGNYRNSLPLYYPSREKAEQVVEFLKDSGYIEQSGEASQFFIEKVPVSVVG